MSAFLLTKEHIDGPVNAGLAGGWGDVETNQRRGWICDRATTIRKLPGYEAAAWEVRP